MPDVHPFLHLIFLMACFVIVMINIFNSTVKLKYQHGYAQLSLVKIF